MKFTIFLFILFYFSCNPHYRKLNTHMIEGDIYPESFFTGALTTQCLNVRSPEMFAAVDNSGKITTCEIVNPDNITTHEAYTFSFPCDQYYSINTQPYIWGYALREFEIFDLQSGKSKSLMTTYNGNSKICQIDIFSQTPFLLHIDVVKFGWKKDVHTGFIYDPQTNAIIDTIPNFQGEFFLLKDNNKIVELFGSYPKKNKWILSDDLKEFNKSNTLTQKLSDCGMRVWAISYNPLKQLLVGHTLINDDITNYSIRWDSTFEDIKIEPITCQFPKDRIFSERFQFSPDGKWMLTVSSDHYNLDIDYITFFHIDHNYPQSISIPVYGSKSQIRSRGCFVETALWGTVYIDVSEHYPGHLMVYKMSDVQNKIIEKMRNMAR